MAHTLLYITVRQRNRPSSSSSSLKIGRTILVDCAGCERRRATAVCGTTLRQAVNVSKSLTALGNVIAALAGKAAEQEKKYHIPYRDSKLTRLLQDSLGGTSRTAFVACLSTCAKDNAESEATLRFVSRAEKVVNSVRPHEEESLLVSEDPKEISTADRDCALKTEYFDSAMAADATALSNSPTLRGGIDY